MVKIGYISFVLTETGGTQNSEGDILPTSETVSSFFPCNIKRMTHEYKLYDEGTGQYKDASYSVIVEKRYTKDLDLSNLTKVYLRDYSDSELGGFQVQSKVELVLVDKLKIVV